MGKQKACNRLKTEHFVSPAHELDNTLNGSGDAGQMSDLMVSRSTSLRSNIPKRFYPVDCKRELKDVDSMDQNTELWLVRVPDQFDVSLLNGAMDNTILDADSHQKLKIKEEGQKRYYNLQTFRNADECKKLSTVVVDNKSGQICLGRSLQHMMTVTETIKLPPLQAGFDAIHVPEKRVPLPAGLKVRFRPFGAGQPWKNKGTKSRHKKKKRSRSKGETDSPRKEKDAVKNQGETNITSDTLKAEGPDSTPRKQKTHRISESFSQLVSMSDSAAEFEVPTPKKHKISRKRKLNASLDGEEAHQDNGRKVKSEIGVIESAAKVENSSPRRKQRIKLERETRAGSAEDDSASPRKKHKKKSKCETVNGPGEDESSPPKKKYKIKSGTAESSSPHKPQVIKSESETTDCFARDKSSSPHKKWKIKKETESLDGFTEDNCFFVDCKGQSLNLSVSETQESSSSHKKKHKKDRKRKLL